MQSGYVGDRYYNKEAPACWQFKKSKKMKTLIRYISLLICGLVLFFYHDATNTIGNRGKTYPYLTKTQPVKKSLQSKLDENSFSFFKDVILNIVPTLKILKWRSPAETGCSHIQISLFTEKHKIDCNLYTGYCILYKNNRNTRGNTRKLIFWGSFKKKKNTL